MTRAFILRIFESYFRHRWLNLLPLVVMLAAGGGYVALTPRQYITQGLIYVPRQSYLATLSNVTTDPASPWISASQATSNEIKELLQSDTFIRSIIQKTDLAPYLGASPDYVKQLILDVRQAIWATTQGDDEVVVGTQYKSPTLAFQIASATIENYTQWRIDANLAQSTAAQSFFTDLVQKYTTEVDTARQALNQYLLEHPAPQIGSRPETEQIELNRLQGDLDQAQARLTDALDKEESARLAASQAAVNTRQALNIIDAPTIPDRPATSLKQIALRGSLFAIVGALLSALAILGGALVDRSFFFPIEVTLHLNLPVLATVPDVAPRRHRSGRQAKQTSSSLSVEPRPVPSLGAGQSARAHDRALMPPEPNPEPAQPVEQAG